MPDRPITYRGVVYPRQCDPMAYMEMRNDETGEIVATAEMTRVHRDTARRKSCPLPSASAGRTRARIVPGMP